MSGHFLFIHVNLLAPVESPDTIPISEATILAHLKSHGFSCEILGDFANSLLNPMILTHAAHLFRTNGQPHKALELLDRTGKDGQRERLTRAQALFDMNRLEESEATVKDMKPLNIIEFTDLRVQLAAELVLPVETYLERQEALLDAKTQAMTAS